MTITAEIRAIVERVKNLGPEWHHTASKLEDAARAAEDARADRLAFLENCLTQTTDRLAKLKEEIRTLPEQIAKWEAERERLESQTGADIVREAVRAEKPRAEVEAMANAREEQGEPKFFAVRDIPKAWLDAHDGVWEDEAGDRVANMAPDRRVRPRGTTWDALKQKAEKPEPPALLDLRTLKVGTVCEATGQIVTYLAGRIQAGETFRIVDTDDGMGDGFPMSIVTDGGLECCVPALVPARVVEVPK